MTQAGAGGAPRWGRTRQPPTLSSLSSMPASSASHRSAATQSHPLSRNFSRAIGSQSCLAASCCGARSGQPWPERCSRSLAIVKMIGPYRGFRLPAEIIGHARYVNNQAEVSHQPTRRRAWQMQRSKLARHAHPARVERLSNQRDNASPLFRGKSSSCSTRSFSNRPRGWRVNRHGLLPCFISRMAPGRLLRRSVTISRGLRVLPLPSAQRK